MAIVTVTYLQMFARDAIRPGRAPDIEFTVREAKVKQWRFNRFLYEMVGADWQWTDKLTWLPGQWADYGESGMLRTFVGYHGGSPAGYFELRDQNTEVQIVYFGLSPAFVGKGCGGHLLTRALEEAWDMSPARVWVHTCSKDHPAALPNYKARGLQVYKEEHVPLP